MKQAVLTLSQLREEYGGQHIPYQTLLGTQEWKAKRDAIVERDKEKCTKCGCPPTDNVWHGGKIHFLLSVPRDPNELIKIGDFLYRGEELGDEIHQLYAPVVLHVHHLYYIRARYPWEYENEALTTLCNDCHLAIHKTQIIPVYKIENGNRIGVPVETCSRCNGAGYFPQYSRVNDGRCFKCEGARYTNLIL